MTKAELLFYFFAFFALAGFFVWFKRRDQLYLKQTTGATMRPELKAEADAEIQAERIKKSRFEALLQRPSKK